MMTKLKPCPFCGGEAAIEGIQYFIVKCTECGAETRGDKPKARAIAQWNRRVGDDLMERMIDDDE